MRSFQVRVSIGIGATVNDLITAAGINAYFGGAANITFYANADAPGLTHRVSHDDGQNESTVIPSGAFVGAASTPGKVKTNEDFVVQFAVPGGAKLLVSASNPTGAAVNYNALVVVT